MEFEVRVVGGMETCFVSFPLSLIHTLQTTVAGGVLPPVIALELRSRTRSGDAGLWNVAWSGSASRSAAIEVAQQLAECISLPDRIEVKVKVVPHLRRAAMVSVEPYSEDDWEILELNSDLAEDAILKQVGIVHEGMKFPLWLHGHVVVLFLVLSTSPKGVVQLVPGTEVAVAPKLRRKDITTCQGVHAQTSAKEQPQIKALLRVQVESKRMVHKLDFHGMELGVALTTAVFIHPETAKNLSLNNLQLVSIMPRSPQKCNMPHNKDSALKRSSSSSGEGNINSSPPSKDDPPRHMIVRILLSDSVARGHVMIPCSLCHFLRAHVHSWVYVKTFDVNLKKGISKLTLSPCWFKSYGRSNASGDLGGLKYFKNKSPPSMFNALTTADDPDWSLYDEFLSSFSCASSRQGNEELTGKYETRQKENLIHAWLTGQLQAIASHVGEVVAGSIVLANETLFHFEVSESELEEKTKQQLSSGALLGKGSITNKAPTKIVYVMSAAFDESSVAGPHDGFEIFFKVENVRNGILNLELDLGKVELGEPISLNSSIENKWNQKYSSTLSSLSWLETASLDAIKRLTVLLSPSSGKLLSAHKLPLPGHVLIYGPPGCGKTSLTTAIAKFFEEHGEILAHIVFISCSKLALEKAQAVREALTLYLSEALVHSPSLLIFDDLDHIVPSSSELEGSQPSNSVTQLVEFFADVMDEYGERREKSCGLGPIAFMASVQSLGNLPHSLSSSGRFDFHIQLPAPAVSERTAILKHELQKRSLECPADILSEVASKCDAYDAYDLEILIDRAVHAAIGRYLSSHAFVKENKPSLVKNDFSLAMQDFTPVAMRGLAKGASKGEHSGWEDVGGLVDIRNAIQEMIEMPSRFPSIFAQAPLRMRSNVLLYGPPGCGKTHIVGAAAAACSLRFISVKGPELLNKYIGASEQAVRDLFSKAAAAAPCLLFFDEFDSIAPKRGHDNTGVTDRVVNQLLTELDGVEALTGVFVFAATSRPDLLDAALLRPGRLDRLLFCDFPSWQERLDILKVLSRKLPLANDVSLETIASMTEGFSGADLQALLSDSQLASVHELLDNIDSEKPAKSPVITDVLLKSVALKGRPSVSESEKQRLYGIYNQFLDSKKSVNTQSGDRKGKRATLA